MSWKAIKNVNSWQEFVEVQSPLREYQRGKPFELLTELFLQIDPIYRSKLKHVWHVSSLPPSVRHKLGVPDPEIGIDLVAQSTTGEYWAIQCKYHHDPSENLTLKELNSFINTTQVVCKNKFDTCLAVSCAYGYSPKLKKHYPQFQYCLGDRFQTLDKDFFLQARALIRKQTPKLVASKKRPHQRTAVKNAVKHFVTNNEKRGKLIHPCGSGKSLIGYWIAEALEARTILVALPSLFLVRQTLIVWAKESLAQSKNMEWMVVCSADDAGDTTKGDPAMRFQEIGVDVTTKTERIATFLRRRTKGRKVIFTTYQSGEVTAKAARKANRLFDLGIFDEAHRTAGQKDSPFSHLVHDKNIRVRRRVFMTATERRYRGKSDNILSMDDIATYGETFDLMTFKQALEQKEPILCDYQVITHYISGADIQQLIDKNFLVKPDKGKWDDDTEAQTLAALIELRTVMRDHRANHALTFHNSIAKAKAFKLSQEQFNSAAKGYGKVDCFHVSSEVGLGERRAELEKFELSKKALITNAKCLSEGVDVPNIDAILFAEPKRSTIDIVQAIGRALRPAEGKKMAYIVIPVLVDLDDPEATKKAFQDILMMLRAIASSDERIIDYFRSVSQGKSPSKSDSIIVSNVSDSIAVKLDDFIDNIESKVWHRLAKLSWMPFEQALAFVQELELKSREEWKQYVKGKIPNLPTKPEDIPAKPDSVYQDRGWQGYTNWLGIDWLPFDQARAFAHSLALKKKDEWSAYCRDEMPKKPPLPANVPATPRGVYLHQGWTGWGDWLGTGTIATKDRKYLPLEEARPFVHSLGLKSVSEWNRYKRGEMPDKPELPENIPRVPNATYADEGWQGHPDWLGIEIVATKDRVYLPYEQACSFVHKLKLKNQKQWQAYCRGEMRNKPELPANIPASPYEHYRKKKSWVSFGDWLGPGRLSRRYPNFRPFAQAKAFAHSLKLKNQTQWRKYCAGEIPGLKARPQDIPTSPDTRYKNEGWIDWSDWLGTEKDD